MTTILAIESSGPVCSVAWGMDGNCVQLLEEQEVNSHAERLPQFCDTLLKQFGKPDAIALNTGPGSYTGLRIGTSLAKGLAYGYRIPLIGISGIPAMAQYYKLQEPLADWIIPCIDARRMEVYQAAYALGGKGETPISPMVVDVGSWSELPGMKHLIGEGANKLQGVLSDRNDIAVIPGILPSARYLLPESFRKFVAQTFLDLAYFEPYYLKEFQATTSKK